MSTLAIMYFHIDIANLVGEKKVNKQYLTNLVSECSEILFRQKVEVNIEIKDGSVKVWITVIGTIYIAIGQYGSFRSGVDRLIKDAKLLKNIVVSDFVKNGIPNDYIKENRTLPCTTNRIHRIFTRIDRLENNLSDTKPDVYRKKVESIRRAVDRSLIETQNEKDARLILEKIKEEYLPTYRIPEKQELMDNVLYYRKNELKHSLEDKLRLLKYKEKDD